MLITSRFQLITKTAKEIPPYFLNELTGYYHHHSFLKRKIDIDNIQKKTRENFYGI